MFNSGRYHERAATGQLAVTVFREGHPSPIRSGQPYCTRSQMLVYRDLDGKKVAIAHQYLRPDGSIGVSGRPDPKRIMKEGIIYAVV